jgi:hypothetical protein
MVSRWEFAGGYVELGGWAVEEAIGEGAADALLEEDEHKGDTDTLFGEAVGVRGRRARVRRGRE